MMAPCTIVTGLVLIGLGGWGYLGAEVEHRSMTALIPAFFGLPLLLLGALALNEQRRKHAMHAAAALGLLGFLGAAGMVVRKLAQGGSLEGRGPTSQAIMAGVCALFVALCVNSFIQARRARTRREASSPL